MKKLLLLHFLFSGILLYQWFWQNPTPIGKPINDMQFIDSLNGYVCGNGGMILKTTNGGLKWEELEVPPDQLIIRIFFLNKDIGWYLSYRDKSLYKTTDAGINWSFVSSFSPKYARSFWFVNELKGFAVGYQKLLKTSDGGLSWIEDTNIGFPHSIQFLNENLGYIGSNNRISKTTDGGNTWIYKGIPAFNFNPYKIYVYDTNNIYAVGIGENMLGGSIYLYYNTSNGGTTWTGKEFEKQVTDVYFETPTQGWVCAGNIFKTTDRGVNWDSLSNNALRFEFIGNNSWSTNSNTIDYSDDKWQTFIPQVGGVFSGFLWDGCAKDTNVAFASGSYKTIIGTYDGGKNWNKYYSSSDNYYLNGIIIYDNDIWAVGEHGTVISGKDNGVNWNEITIMNSNWLNDITFISNGVGYIAGSHAGGGGIFTSIDQGKTWTLLQNFSELVSIEKIKFSRDNLGWAIGYPRTILRSTSGGTSWDVVIDTVYSVSNIAVYGDSVWVTYNNKVLRSTDAGNTWESFKVFDYNTMVFSGCDIDFVNSKIGYISALDSRVFKSIDGGETWVPEIYPEGLNNFALDFVNENVGWVFGYPGIVLKRDPNLVSVNDPLYESNDLNSFSLMQNYPNPFNPATTISYSISAHSLVNLKIFNTLGQEIATLVNEEKAPGIYQVEFDAGNLSSGIYLYKIQAGDFVQARKMILIK